MAKNGPRLAVRAVIVHDDRLLLVNAYANGQSDLMCAPGGGVEVGASLPDNLAREVFEETGLRIDVGAPCLVNEFHDPTAGFHQVDFYFRCTVIGSTKIAPAWQDVENIVTDRRWVTHAQMAELRVKPDSLIDIAFGDAPISYDPLELIVR
ncbi:MAG: NUDIX domain-containing protein [Sulfitobacter sp.]|nr:NUDIX domain-containing protein [Sulfitobacter sp.]